MESLRVGVIGVGHLGMHHARLYTEILGAHLVGILDTDESRANIIADGLGVSAYTNIDQFLKEARPEALSIAVPTSLHYEVAKKAMERGIHPKGWTYSNIAQMKAQMLSMGLAID